MARTVASLVAERKFNPWQWQVVLTTGSHGLSSSWNISREFENLPSRNGPQNPPASTHWAGAPASHAALQQPPPAGAQPQASELPRRPLIGWAATVAASIGLGLLLSTPGRARAEASCQTGSELQEPPGGGPTPFRSASCQGAAARAEETPRGRGGALQDEWPEGRRSLPQSQPSPALRAEEGRGPPLGPPSPDGPSKGSPEGRGAARGGEPSVRQIVRRELEQRLAASPLPTRHLSLPNIMVKGQQISVHFSVDPSCDVAHLVTDVIARLGAGDSGALGGGAEMAVRAWVSPVARQLTISPPPKPQPERGGDGAEPDAAKKADVSSEASAISVMVFFPVLNTAPAEIEFVKKGLLTYRELDTVAHSLIIAHTPSYLHPPAGKRGGVQSSPAEQRPPAPFDRLPGGMPRHRTPVHRRPTHGSEGEGARSGDWRREPLEEESEADRNRRTVEEGRQKAAASKALNQLREMGVRVYGVAEMEGGGGEDGELGRSGPAVPWDNLAGYEEQKREIEDTVLLALRRPDVYEAVARGTRRKFESNRPRAVLFEGPPGTGKTSCARVIASQAGVPLLYVPLEVIASKYYGEAERSLASVFSASKKLPNGAIVFLDEIDALATTRDSEMHEATRRVLSVLLRQMDGFEKDSKVVVIAATNRKEDLDPALVSRFDTSILFDLPDDSTRAQIFAQYARHLSEADLRTLSAACEGVAGRDIRDICEQTERRWASRLVREGVDDLADFGLPSLPEYMASAQNRRKILHSYSGNPPGGPT